MEHTIFLYNTNVAVPSPFILGRSRRIMYTPVYSIYSLCGSTSPDPGLIRTPLSPPQSDTKARESCTPSTAMSGDMQDRGGGEFLANSIQIPGFRLFCLIRRFANQDPQYFLSTIRSTSRNAQEVHELAITQHRIAGNLSNVQGSQIDSRSSRLSCNQLTPHWSWSRYIWILP